MRRGDAYPSKYLGKEDLDRGPVRGTVQAVEMEKIKTEAGHTEEKVVIYYEEIEKGMICNATNWDILEELFDAEDSDDWIGQVCEIYVDPSVRFAGKKVGGLRVRKPGKRRGRTEPEDEDQTPRQRKRPVENDPDAEPPTPNDDDNPFN